jgi:hypothetical protein
MSDYLSWKRFPVLYRALGEVAQGPARAKLGPITPAIFERVISKSPRGQAQHIENRLAAMTPEDRKVAVAHVAQAFLEAAL